MSREIFYEMDYGGCATCGSGQGFINIRAFSYRPVPYGGVLKDRLSPIYEVCSLRLTPSFTAGSGATTRTAHVTGVGI